MAANLPQEVLDAFGITEKPVSLAGGRSLCLLAGDIVLKPSDDDEESQWASEVLLRLLEQQSLPLSYRVPRPVSVKKHATAFVFQGWTASSLLPGQEDPAGKCEQIVQVSRAFHRDLRQLYVSKPDFMNRRESRWAEADRVTWGEKLLSDVALVNKDVLARVEGHLQDLKTLQRPLPADMEEQLIHGDLTGNVLFGSGADIPGIIDMTFYWRPAAYAEAIVVADCLMWHKKGHELLEVYGTDEVRLQLLVRALYWRFITFAIDSYMEWVNANMPKADFHGSVKLLQSVMSS